MKGNKDGEYMKRRFKEVRRAKFSSAAEAAEKLGVSQPTISAWEAGRKTPSIEALENMADLYGVTTDYLLGRMEALKPDYAIDNQLVAVFDGRPVWSPKYGWMLVNAKKYQLLSSQGEIISFSDACDLYTAPQPFMQTPLPIDKPLNKEQLNDHDEIWVEPISQDQILRDELRGWYRVMPQWVENDVGNRFLVCTYGSKWVAYSEYQK
ncbi:MAG: helix-turn-helix domain-containing protein [Bariatricus sp.]